MGKNLALCMLAFVLWGCSSDGNTIVDEPENGETPVVDSDISLDTPPREYAGYVYKYQDLDYEYLVTLGFDARCEYSTVPEDTLNKLTTEALAQTCLFWPVVGNHVFYPTYQLSVYDGLLVSFEHCNALQELAKREYGEIALLKLYKHFKLGETETGRNWHETDISKLNQYYHKQHLELLLTTEYFTPKLSKPHLVLLAEEVERLLLEGAIDGEIRWFMAQYSYVLWQRILLCYDKYTPILSDTEKQVFDQNIKCFGMPGVDKTKENISLITEKVKLMLDKEKK